MRVFPHWKIIAVFWLLLMGAAFGKFVQPPENAYRDFFSEVKVLQGGNGLKTAINTREIWLRDYEVAQDIAVYAYCLNDPINCVDVLGLASVAIDHGMGFGKGLSITDNLLKPILNNQGQITTVLELDEAAQLDYAYASVSRLLRQENALAQEAEALARALVQQQVKSHIDAIFFAVGTQQIKPEQGDAALFELQRTLGRNGHVVPPELIKLSQQASNRSHDLEILSGTLAGLGFAVPGKAITTPIKGLSATIRGVIAGGRVATNTDRATRLRVIANILESQKARASSNFTGGVNLSPAKISNGNATRLLYNRALASGASPEAAMERALSVVSSFRGPITARRALAGETFEVFADANTANRATGIYVTRGLAGNTTSLQRQIMLALPNSLGVRNSAIRVGQGTLTRDQFILEGIVGGQQGGIFGTRYLPGGAYQGVTDGGIFTGAIHISF